MRWEIFCRVVDNHGDLGFCWRLAAELAARGEAVRLWVDAAQALAWMAPAGAPGVDLQAWSEDAPATVGEVVVETFGCDPPATFVQAMAQRQRAPVWINLEYLSAQAYAERSHGLPSPQPCGLVKRFFFPGFSAGTGGLLRERDLPAAQATHDGRRWLAERGWAPRGPERVLSLFGYAQPRLAAWLPLLAQQPTLLLVAPGPLQQQLRGLAHPTGLRVVELPWLTQAHYDRLLWSCDLNAVRGEDSFVRAHWAGPPLLWQIYRQDDGAHEAKLEAWLDRLLQGVDDRLASAIRHTQRAWNGIGPLPAALPSAAAWRAVQGGLRQQLLAQPGLVERLLAFVAQETAPR